MIYCVLWCSDVEFVDKILNFDYSNESYWAVLFIVVLFIMLYEVVLSFGLCMDKILNFDHLKKLMSGTSVLLLVFRQFAE